MRLGPTTGSAGNDGSGPDIELWAAPALMAGLGWLAKDAGVSGTSV